MANILGTGQYTITDLHDAIISGTAPSNPKVGTLWIDTSVTPNILKSWNGNAWVNQSLDLNGIDPEAGQDLSDAKTTLNSLSADNIITKIERSYIKDKVTDIVGKILADTASMPDLANVDSSGSGEACSVRKEAITAGLTTTHASYVAVGTEYTNLANYLNAMSPKPWDTTSNADITITASDWRDKWLKYYEAVYALRTAISDKLKQTAESAGENTVQIAKPYNGVEITPENGFEATRSDNKVKTTLNATDGIKIERSTDGGTSWVKKFYADANGIIYANGLVISSDSTIAGQDANTVVSNAANGNATAIAAQSTATAAQNTANATNDQLNKDQGVNKWLFKRYNITTPAGTIPTYDTIKSLQPYDRSLISDGTSLVNNIADNYIGHLKTAVYVNSAKNISYNFTHDDGATIYLNGASVYAVGTYTQNVLITLSLKAGWNTIEYLWAEHTGGDGIYNISAAMNTLVDKMSCYSSSDEGRLLNAESFISDIMSDLKVTPPEKDQLSNTWESIKAEYDQLSMQAASLNVSASAYTTAYNNLNGVSPKIAAEILATMTSTYTFTSTTNRDAFKTKISTYFTEAEKLRKAISDATLNYTNTVNSIMRIDNAQSTYFPFDSKLTSTNGLGPDSGYLVTLRKLEGRFNGAASIEEGTTNLMSDPFLTNNANKTVGTTTLTKGTFNVGTENLQGLTLVQGASADIINISTPVSTVPTGQITFSAWMNSSITSPLKAQINCTVDDVKYWLTDANTWVTTSTEKTNLFSSYTKIGQWQRISYTIPAFPSGTLSAFSMSGWYRTAPNIVCSIANLQLEQKPFATGFVNGTRADGVLKYSPTLTSNFSLLGYRKHVLDTDYTHMAITKNGDTFTMYKNGVATTEWKNKWIVYSMTGVGSALKTNNIVNYTKPIGKMYWSDGSSLSHNLSTANYGYLMRTFVYAKSAVTVWHRYNADNYGGIRINNGTFKSVGGWMNASVNSTNPDIQIDLVPGWNVIEMTFMDGDTGGAISLQKNSQGQNLTGADTQTGFVASVPLSQVPEVLYMTAELPIEFSSASVYFNEKSNVMVDELVLSSKVFTASEISAIYNSQSPFIDSNPKVIVPKPSSVTMTIS